MVLLIVLLCTAITLSSAAVPKWQFEVSNAGYHFNEFIRNHNKQYVNSYEREKRFKIFKDNLEVINQINSEDSAEHGITRFADLTAQEFEEIYGCASISNGTKTTCIVESSNLPVDYTAPDNFDWRAQQKVTNVQDQGKCGSCWTFSVIGSVEGKYAIKYNSLKDFSQQQLVDCDKSNYGCRGGFLDRAMEYLTESGVMLSKDYPYKGREGECKYDPSKKAASVTKCNIHKPKNEEDVKRIVVDNGPLSIAIDGSVLRFYTTGILDRCVWRKLNHAVVLVGYGVEKSVPYWIIKNSWGPGWGESGYVRVKINISNCRMTTDIISSDVA